MLSFRLVVLALAALALLAACSPSAGTPAPSGPQADVSISAKDLKFDQSTLEAPAGRPFTLRLDNQESAPHNVAIATDSTFANKLFTGELVSSQQITYDVPALQAGTYPFRCDLHPEMAGTLVAK